MINTIEKITQNAKKGDFVCMHFSGHGTAIRPPRANSPDIGKRTFAFSNPSTGDLALVLLRRDGLELQYLHGEIFGKYNGIGRKLHYIQQILRARIESTREQYRHTQTPVVPGNKTLDFFGYDNPRIGPAPIPVIKCRDGTVRVDAGKAHGVRDGDTFTISAVMFDDSIICDTMSVQNYCTAEVIAVRPLTSLVKLSVTTAPGEPTLAATALKRHALKKFPIQLQIGHSYPEG
ncbi:cysteine-type endopeptidase [Ascochyta rabiei]|uniref:Cysteine-type endopeptidase n=1 Tax=Didymella rabiei TaxID=5454 RepID=A0A163CW80_DIDRA|nr:cysteine-type endopeptidase [Ascochyta rabiei]